MHFNLAYLITVLFAISVYTAPVTNPSSCVDLDIRDESSFGCGHGHLTVRPRTANGPSQAQLDMLNRLNRMRHWNTITLGIYVTFMSDSGTAYEPPSSNLEGYPNIQKRISTAIYEHMSPSQTHRPILYLNRFKSNDPNPSAILVAFRLEGKTLWSLISIDKDGVPTVVAQTQASSLSFSLPLTLTFYCSRIN
ncbi:hypothetical protein GGU10DRAFT_30458 [Lentinula aff. detonsa]|uniref:Uncharacterized protein n=1 Tax=Lentinula aff. detonsa TaxID=2804958 RepID=A0AA38NLJ9_9AGAR|nr:hypothetical protein GGU10DRAFT_30458 [Lentinula aff. detonsa]